MESSWAMSYSPRDLVFVIFDFTTFCIKLYRSLFGLFVILQEHGMQAGWHAHLHYRLGDAWQHFYMHGEVEGFGWAAEKQIPTPAASLC